MSNTIPTQVSWTVADAMRPAKGDAATRRTPASGASGSPEVVLNKPSPRAEQGPEKAQPGVTERSHEASARRSRKRSPRLPTRQTALESA